MSKSVIHNWSSYQQSIFTNVAKGTGNTVVIARAGAAKTSSLIESLSHMPKNTKALLVAFNKSIAEELKTRAPKHVECLTLHSLGFRAIRNKFGNVVLDNKKCFNIVQGLIGPDDYDLITEICKTITFCKACIADTPDKVSSLMDEYGIDPFPMKREDFILTTLKVLRLCKEQTQVIDFDDMIYFPFVYNLTLPLYDYVFCDEMQDLTALMTVLAIKSTKKNGRFFGFCDPKQAIYSWRGSDFNTVNGLIEKLNPTKLSLPISYRCPVKVIKFVNDLVPDIEHAPGAKEGTIEELVVEDMLKKVKPGDFVISRVNAPLVKYCMALLKNGIPANIKGRDIGSGLLQFVKKSKAKTIDSFLKYLKDWETNEIRRFLIEKKDSSIVTDKAECLSNLCEGCKSIKELKASIEKLFVDEDDSKKVLFSSVHKIKGLEAKNVFVLNWTIRKGFNQEEDNIAYVAYTRAKENLFLVSKVKK
jgi:DNA helicase II / ATP-dependent DNA helicase PcrA